jgi:hypothetical protein
MRSSNRWCETNFKEVYITEAWAFQFHMRRLEQLCVQYLEATINHQNVLEALHNASHLNLFFIKEFCLKFIVKETNYNQIVMSKDFEKLEQPLMVEIIRQRQQTPQSRSQAEHQFENTGGCYGIDIFSYVKQ